MNYGNKEIKDVLVNTGIPQPPSILTLHNPEVLYNPRYDISTLHNYKQYAYLTHIHHN